MRLRLLAAMCGVLALPATASAAEAEAPSGTDYTIQVMLGLIIFLMVAMIVVGILETRKGGH